jgi:AcrR family transcriptional regulator
MNERARSQEETRLRIVEATMHLHEEVGPRATTISAIAERAGVQRLTVYRHFADETAVFEACTTHWLELNPPPDPTSWEAIADPRARVEAALQAFYRYYSGTRRMWDASHRDVADVPALQGPMKEFAGYVAAVADSLAGAFGLAGEGSDAVRATIGHALTYPAFADIEQRVRGNREQAALVLSWVDGVIGASGR